MEKKTFETLEVGDLLKASDGSLTPVTRVYDVHVPETMYRLEFEDGTVMEASGNHLWYVETDVDRALHRRRLREGRRLFKDLEDSLLQDMEEVLTADGPVEIAMADAVDIFGARENPALFQALVRIAESIGPVAEETTAYQDLLDGGEAAPSSTERLYDAKRMFSQVLALRTPRWKRRHEEVIVGRVVSTEELLFMGEVSLPEIRPHQPAGESS